MKSNPPLSGSHLRTYNTIFQHPVSHNLNWRAVHSLLGALGEIVEEPNGNLKATRNGQTLVLHPASTKDVAETEELMALRHFLERSEPAAPAANGNPEHCLLVLDHQEARIFRAEMRGSIPDRILPHEPSAFFRHAHNSRDFSRGREKPDPNSYFEPLAAALQAAGGILIFGTGTGMGSEMEQFVAWSKEHRPDLAGRIVGSVAVDEHHLSEAQLLARAREFYLNAQLPQT
jgi:hypothetical protein